MPRRRGKFIPPPSHLSRVLERLNAGPRLALNGLRRISLTYAARNDHMGARYFVKEELPRIRWANPLLDIAVHRVPKTREEIWAPPRDGGVPRTNPPVLAAGHPILPGEEKERLMQNSKRRKANAAEPPSPGELEAQVQDMLNAPSRPKTGAAAILP
ncbi:hypothetical protein J3R83DRAFT_7152 [Lanmaoa asiatica]|nr:hypothetical protein J3R83DRAFT_7152 [Lanmaoa asiatica]